MCVCVCVCVYQFISVNFPDNNLAEQELLHVGTGYVLNTGSEVDLDVG